MERPALVIFDMDGVLFDTERLFMNTKNEVLTEYGYPAREEDYIQTIGLAGKQLYEKMAELYGPDYPADEITAETRAKMMDHIKKYGPSVKPGIPEFLSRLEELHIPCCIASSSDHSIIEQYVAQSGLEKYFSFYLGGNEFKRSKPFPDIFLAACKKAGAAPARALVIEDSENGVLAAHNAEIPVVCIPDLKEPSPDIRAIATVILRSADELLPLL